MISALFVSGCAESLETSDAWLDVPASLFVRTHDVPIVDEEASPATDLDTGSAQDPDATPQTDPDSRGFAIQTDTSLALTPWVEPGSDSKSVAAGPAESLPSQPLALTTAVQSSDAKGLNAEPAGPEPFEESTKTLFDVQFDSFLSQDAAERELLRLRSAYPDLLGGKRLAVRRASHAAGGIVYSVRTGGFADHQSAEDFCAQITARNEGCSVVADAVATQRVTGRFPGDQAQDGLFEQFLLWQQERGTGAAPREAEDDDLFEQFLRWRQQRTE